LTNENVLIIDSLKNLEEKIFDLKIYGVNLGRELFFKCKMIIWSLI